MYKDTIITMEEVRERSQGGFKFSKVYHLVTERILEAVKSGVDILDIEWDQRGIYFCTKKGEQWNCSNSMHHEITKEEFDEVVAEVKKGWGDRIKQYDQKHNRYMLLLHKL